MKTKTKIRNESAIFIVTLLGIVILLNIISVKFFARGDLTKGDQFTLSNASISLVKNLGDKLLVKAYFTKNLPGRYATLERNVKDVLEEFEQHSNGNMEVTFMDPGGDEEEEKVAESLGINKMPNPDIEKDQATVKEGYRGIAFSYRDKTEVIRAVETPVGLEYDIATSLKKILGEKSAIGFVVGHGEPTIETQNPNPMLPENQQNPGEFRTLRNNLDIYDYKQVNLKESKEGVPSEVKALVMAGTSNTVTDLELFELDQFLLGGGSIAVLMDGVSVEEVPAQHPALPSTYNVKANGSNLRDFLKHHGVAVGQQMVMDAQAANVIARCPPIPLPIPRLQPAWPIVTSFGEEHPVTYGVDTLTLPFVSSVRGTEEALKDKGKKVREIAYSSANVWSVSPDGAEVDPCKAQVSDKFENPIPLAAVVTGSFGSYFKGKELPKKGDEPLKPEAFLEKSKKPGKLIVVGSSEMPTDRRISELAKIDRRQALNNFAFMQNVLDWMTNEEDLIAVRMKTTSEPPISKDLSEGAKAAIKFGNIAGIPLLLMLFGVVRWILRRAPKTVDASEILSDPKFMEKRQRAIFIARVWAAIGVIMSLPYFGIAGLFSEDNMIGVMYGSITVGCVFIVGSILGLVGAFSIARILYIVGGIVGLPLGAIMFFGSRAMRKAAEVSSKLVVDVLAEKTADRKAEEKSSGKE